MKHSPFQHDAPRMPASRRTPAAPRGFTLVELLMVVVIIGILSALIITASMSLLGTSREAATKATLSKINTLLKQRMSAFEVQLSNDYTSGAHRTDPYVTSVNNQPEHIKKIFYRKKLFKKYFPQTWEEAKLAGILSASDLQTTASSAGVEADSESSEVLFAILTKTALTWQGEVGQDAFMASELADKDGDGKKELVDSWGNPLRFYRWPCRLIKPSATSTDWTSLTQAELDAARTQIPALTKSTGDPTLNNDPDNPLNENLDSLLSYAMPPPGFQYLNEYHIPQTYHTPLVVSSGVDGLFGLVSPIDADNNNRQAMPTANTAELYDNLTNLNALAGGNQ